MLSFTSATLLQRWLIFVRRFICCCLTNEVIIKKKKFFNKSCSKKSTAGLISNQAFPQVLRKSQKLLLHVKLGSDYMLSSQKTWREMCVAVKSGYLEEKCFSLQRCCQRPRQTWFFFLQLYIFQLHYWVHCRLSVCFQWQTISLTVIEKVQIAAIILGSLFLMASVSWLVWSSLSPSAKWQRQDLLFQICYGMYGFMDIVCIGKTQILSPPYCVVSQVVGISTTWRK